MTVETSARSQVFAGGQGTLDFLFKTVPSHPEHIKVTLKLISTGAETELTYDSDYTVSLESDGGGGTVTVSPTYATTYTQTVWRDTTQAQSSDYEDYNQFPADTLENDLDRLMCLTQEISEEVDRCVKNPITNPTATTLAQIAAIATTCSTQATAAAASATTAGTQATAAAASAADAASSAVGIASEIVTFDDDDLAVGILTITHSYALSAPYILEVTVFDNNGKKVMPDEITGSANSTAVDLSSYGTISGTWGVMYGAKGLVEIASQAEAEAGTNNTKLMTPLRTFQSIMSLVYPIGSVVTLGVATNPGTLFGVGTWTAITGRVIVGIAGSGTFDTLDATGGAETVTLTSAQSGVPAHTHTVPSRTDNSGAGTDNVVVEGQAGGTTSTVPVSANAAANAASAHPNLQPYIIKYCWQRSS